MHEHKMNRVMIYLDGGEQHIAYKERKSPGTEVPSRASHLEPGERDAYQPEHKRANLTASWKSSSKDTPKPFIGARPRSGQSFPSGYKVELDNPQVASFAYG